MGKANVTAQLELKNSVTALSLTALLKYLDLI